MPQTVERRAHRKEPRPLSMQEWGGAALATVAKSLSSRKYADIFLLDFFIFPFCSHISLVFLYFSRVCVCECVCDSLQAFLLTYFRVSQSGAESFATVSQLWLWHLFHTAAALSERLSGVWLFSAVFFGSFLTSIKYIFHDYKWDLFAISGNISGSALPSRVCGHKNAKKLFTPSSVRSPLPFAICSALLHFCRINQLFSLLFSLSRRTNLSTQMAPQDNA